jgi:hypothetical protein
MNYFKQAYIAFKSRAEAVGSRTRIEGPISDSVLKDVTDSITNRWQMSIMYAGEIGLKKVVAGRYSITPLMYGLNKFTKNHILRAYVHSGGSFVGFVTFRLDRMQSTTPFKSKTFDQAPPGYNQASDGLMSEIILKVEFPKK